MLKRAGLPVTLKMRHDAHYVESLTSYSGAAVGRMIPVDQIRPNPEQPRKALGDLRELTESVKQKGVLEPLLVRFVAREDCYYIISGERRYHASRAAGLREVPCIEKVADDALRTGQWPDVFASHKFGRGERSLGAGNSYGYKSVIGHAPGSTAKANVPT